MNNLRKLNPKSLIKDSFYLFIFAKITKMFFTVCVFVLMLAGTPIGTMQERRATGC